MAERIAASSMKAVSRKSLLWFFTTTSTLFLLSWFFVLRSSSRPRFIDSDFIPNSKLSTEFDNSTLKNDNVNVESSIGNRAILVNAEEIEATHETESLPQNEAPATNGDESKCGRKNDSVVVPLKVFMYDLPPEFHFGLLDWKPEGNTAWPDISTQTPHYPGGLNLQHSIEFWLTMDLLASELPEPPNAGAAMRVRNVSEADIIFVPFFSSLCYNRHSRTNRRERKSMNRVLQDKLVQFLTSREEWKRSGGVDHLILAHHPNSMLTARTQLWPATLILSDFGRYPPNIANVEKDVIAPYKHVVGSYVNDSSDFDTRPILLYFQGAIHRKDGGHARLALYNMLKNEKDVHFSSGSVQKGGIRQATEGMHSSKFCLNIAGDTPSSNRLFDAIASHCVPVIISDEIELPYEDVLDYSEFCIFVRTRDALKRNYLMNFIRSIGKEEWTRMWNKLKEVEPMFEFQYPSKEGDAVQMIWQAVARRVPAMRLKLHRSRRHARSLSKKERSLPTMPAPVNYWLERRNIIVKNSAA
ncbi:probable arabinosyltransferase ARAD1 [Neltuma alba]|uniref:probable arabinosyltransferase ARAD1 n=1 Tax=Neltuma alba TaxID=207710 RepID=UPI0010A2C3DA|nr:probable arabinosyltransferase ARAD1 [Prosopis alba]